jgi:hypothetical protein
MEQAQIVPCQDKHEWEGNKIAQCPPEVEENPQQHKGHNHTYRHRDKGTCTNVKRTYEHLILDELLDKDLWNQEQQTRRDNRDDEEWQKQQETQAAKNGGTSTRIALEKPITKA